MDFIFELISGRDLVILIGVVVFLFVYKFSGGIFSWIENQTFGTRNYIIERLDSMFIKVNANYITYGLLYVSFGNSALVFILCGFNGYWILGIVLAIIAFFAGWKAPRPIIDALVKMRIKKYQSQMVDGLTLLSNGLRAGLSFPQSLDMVVRELPPPISEEYNLILQQNKLGVPLEECLENLAKRVNTEDNKMFVSSINILRELGGNIAETFDTIVEIIRERIRLQQKIDTNIAQTLFQGAIVFCTPYVLIALFTINDPASMMKAFQHPVGILLMIMAFVLNLIGGFIILKIVKIKI